MISRERFLKLFLRILGTAALLALPCALMPFAWMDEIHRGLGMGRLPSEPIVGYLARSTSLFYALFGGLFWVLSFDLHRNRTVLCYLGTWLILFGLLLGVIDFLEGMPLWWVLAEGPFNVVFGAIILSLGCRLARPENG
jgi:hypothetical protein